MPPCLTYSRISTPTPDALLELKQWERLMTAVWAVQDPKEEAGSAIEEGVDIMTRIKDERKDGEQCW